MRFFTTVEAMQGMFSASTRPVRILRWVMPLLLWSVAATAQASTDGGVYTFAATPAELGDSTAQAQRVDAPAPSPSRSAQLQSARTATSPGGYSLGWAVACAVFVPLLWVRKRCAPRGPRRAMGGL